MGFFGGKKKEKSHFTMKLPQVIETAALVQSALEQWLGFRRFFLKAFTADPIIGEDESSFLEVKALIARSMRSLGDRMDDKMFYFGGDQAAALLRQCVSVSHLRSLPVPDRRQLYKDWHGVFVHLSRTVGAFKFLSEGYVPMARKAAAGDNKSSIAGLKGHASGKFK